MKANFFCKPSSLDLIPQDSFVIEKTIILNDNIFLHFLRDPLADYDFIKENLDLMYYNKSEGFHCIFVTSDLSDFGILIESEGYGYARYAAYFPKIALGN